MTDKQASNIYIMLPLRAPHNLKKNHARGCETIYLYYDTAY